MISVSTKFANAAASDVNKPAYKARLVLGNYASANAYGSTVTSSGDVSADYPAAGAIDGDRTEINVGPAAGADNDIGLSSWRSSGVPDNGDVVTLDITFTEERTINRIKLYHLNGNGLKTYSLSYWDGAAWQVFAATSDIATGDETSIDTTGELDVVDFTELSTTKVRLLVTATDVALDKANVVELEIYRLVDITDRVKGWNVSRGRDYKLANPMSAGASLSCINTDRFFSMNHTPTTAEIAEGFVNDELRPGIGLIVEAGFDIFAGAEPEVVTVFVGTLDSLTLNSRNREATLEARDGMKALINKTDSTKLKAALDIGDAIRYMLNRSNISDFEMEVDTTTIIIDYFFADAQNTLSTVQELAQAAGDSTFYFNEMGTAIFRLYAAIISQDDVFTTEADWETGTLLHIDTTTVPDTIRYRYSQPETWNQSTSGWTVDLESGSGNTFTSDGVSVSLNSNAFNSSIHRASAFAVGEWLLPFQMTGFFTDGLINYGLMAGSVLSTPYAPGIIQPFCSGYVVQFDRSSLNLELFRAASDGSLTSLGSYVSPGIGGFGTNTIRVRRNPDGSFLVYANGTLLITAIDTTYNTSTFFGVHVLKTGSAPASTVRFMDSGFEVPSNENGIWTTPTLDATAAVVAYGTVQITDVLNGGTISIESRSSPDGVTWSAWLAVGVGNQIESPVERYLQVRVIIAIDSSGSTPTVSDLIVTTMNQAGTPKYPPVPASFIFSFDSTLMDVEQSSSDSIGGDTSIINDATVQAEPLLLTGADADDVWQGTVGVPPVPVSGTDPITVTIGDVLIYSPAISGGMDTSRMSGANPAAAVIAFGAGAAGSWTFESIHPTLPVLKVVISATGTITDLRIQGKVFSNSTYFQASNAKDAASIDKYGDRQMSLSNSWIVAPTHAADVAQSLVDNYKDPVAYVPSSKVRPVYNAQIGDRVTIVDDNLDLSADYIITNLGHSASVSRGNGTADTDLTLLKVPEGL